MKRLLLKLLKNTTIRVYVVGAFFDKGSGKPRIEVVLDRQKADALARVFEQNDALSVVQTSASFNLGDFVSQL